jgi:hypothetical protein
VVLEPLLALKDQVLPDGEGHLVLAEQPQRAALGDGGHATGDAVDVDLVGEFALKAEQHSLVAAVPLAGEPE